MLKLFQKWLFLVILIAFAVILYSVSFIQDNHIKELCKDKFITKNLLIKQLLTNDKIEISEFDKAYSVGGFFPRGSFIVLKNKEFFYIGHNLSTINPKTSKSLIKIHTGKVQKITLNKIKYYVYRENFQDYFIYDLIPVSDIAIYKNRSLKVIFAVNILMFIITFILISILVNNLVIKNIFKVNRSLKKITKGDLKEKVSVITTKEFEALSNGINYMVDALKASIEKEKNIIQTELKLAHEVQLSVLPQKIIKNDNVETCSYIRAAKEIGGDFYDYYIVDDKLVFLIADVSGKSIPAALFMMKTKMLLSELLKMKLSYENIIKIANQKLCEKNLEYFFVSVFYGVLDLNTGEVTCINAGHNPPLIQQNNSYKYLDIPVSLVLGIDETVKYSCSKIKLNPSDKIILYTDGITEALNENAEFFGEDKLLEVVNKENLEINKQVKNIINEVDLFTQNKEQSDDITLLAIEYKKNEYNSLTVEAKTENLIKINSWLNEKSSKYDLTDEIKMKLELISEELFVNVCNYAYKNQEGITTIKLNIFEKEIIMEFVDNGSEYNPLEKKEADLNSSIDDRINGGFGIHLVKNNVDEIFYERKNNQNILTLKIYRG